MALGLHVEDVNENGFAVAALWRRRRARDGVAFLFGDRLLPLAMTVAFVTLLFMSAVWVAELFFVENLLGRGEASYGAWLSLRTLGWRWGDADLVLLSRGPGRGARKGGDGPGKMQEVPASLATSQLAT